MDTHLLSSELYLLTHIHHVFLSLLYYTEELNKLCVDIHLHPQVNKRWWNITSALDCQDLNPRRLRWCLTPLHLKPSHPLSVGSKFPHQYKQVVIISDCNVSRQRAITHSCSEVSWMTIKLINEKLDNCFLKLFLYFIFTAYLKYVWAFYDFIFGGFMMVKKSGTPWSNLVHHLVKVPGKVHYVLKCCLTFGYDFLKDLGLSQG